MDTFLETGPVDVVVIVAAAAAALVADAVVGCDRRRTSVGRVAPVRPRGAGPGGEAAVDSSAFLKLSEDAVVRGATAFCILV